MKSLFKKDKEKKLASMPEKTPLAVHRLLYALEPFKPTAIALASALHRVDWPPGAQQRPKVADTLPPTSHKLHAICITEKGSLVCVDAGGILMYAIPKRDISAMDLHSGHGVAVPSQLVDVRPEKGNGFTLQILLHSKKGEEANAARQLAVAVRKRMPDIPFSHKVEEDPNPPPAAPPPEKDEEKKEGDDDDDALFDDPAALAKGAADADHACAGLGEDGSRQQREVFELGEEEPEIHRDDGPPPTDYAELLQMLLAARRRRHELHLAKEQALKVQRQESEALDQLLASPFGQGITEIAGNDAAATSSSSVVTYPSSARIVRLATLIGIICAKRAKATGNM